MKNVLIFGATSAIAAETAKQFAGLGYNIVLAARNPEKANSVINDIKTEYPNSNLSFCNFDALDYQSHKEILNFAHNQIGNIDIILIAHGILPNNDLAISNFRMLKESLENNALSVFSVCEESAKYFDDKNVGTIVVISSVAGDRGRQSNYIYGMTKGAVNIYLQGLRNRLYKKNVNVITVKPGFVDTPMTAHLPKNFLFAKPQDIAKGIVDAIDNKKDIVYLPKYWKLIMLIIKLIPESIFKKLSL